MARRAPYTKFEREHQVRAEHVSGMGDVVFKGFQCLNPQCQHFIFIRKDEISEFFELTCPVCSFVHRYGDESKFYDYRLRDLRDNSIISTGDFKILHDEYVDEAEEFKYCIICNAIKPLKLFDQHSSRKSGRQGECRLCKALYNELKNPTRTVDQHREAAQKRRLYMELTGGQKIDSKRIYEKFDYKCFKCGVSLRQDIQAKSVQRGGNLDHTLPVRYLWPLTTENATLLCQHHNGDKAESWPSHFYSPAKLRRLVRLTGIPYETLSGPAHYNPEAIDRLRNPAFVDALLEKFAAYMEELILIRNRILDETGHDFFSVSTSLSRVWITKADQARDR